MAAESFRVAVRFAQNVIIVIVIVVALIVIVVLIIVVVDVVDIVAHRRHYQCRRHSPQANFQTSNLS